MIRNKNKNKNEIPFLSISIILLFLKSDRLRDWIEFNSIRNRIRFFYRILIHRVHNHFRSKWWNKLIKQKFCLYSLIHRFYICCRCCCCTNKQTNSRVFFLFIILVSISCQWKKMEKKSTLTCLNYSCVYYIVTTGFYWPIIQFHFQPLLLFFSVFSSWQGFHVCQVNWFSHWILYQSWTNENFFFQFSVKCLTFMNFHEFFLPPFFNQPHQQQQYKQQFISLIRFFFSFESFSFCWFDFIWRKIFFRFNFFSSSSFPIPDIPLDIENVNFFFIFL